MGSIDLDKARAARSEAQGETHDLVFNRETFTLPSELPWDWAEAAAVGNLRSALAALLGDEESGRFFASGPSIKDLEVLNERIEELYGIGTEGEASASRSSSKRTSRSSRPPSSDITPS